MPTRHRLATAAVAVAVLGGCALQQQREPDPTLVRLENLERRLEAIERVLANGSLVDLTLQMDDLQRQAADLQGRIERLEFEQESGADRQRSMYADLDERLQTLESGLQQAAIAAGRIRTAAGPSVPVTVGSAQENYEAAFGLLREQRYAQAGEAFAQFLAAFPDSQLADNAQYWLAESHYVTGQFERALTEFEKVLDRYPRSMKVPDAMLKIGFCHYELERWPDARIALSEVVADFPDTTAARLAEQRLAKMSEEGN
ncbi:MAG: tol-pal system protein YbgF [Woeseiaceae bacterium]|nr:tol-pal system protein YbgF [Woeseiaceae bacterium]